MTTPHNKSNDSLKVLIACATSCVALKIILSRGPDRWKIRSKTFSGMADAWADQWGR